MRKLLAILAVLLLVASCKENEVTKTDNILIRNHKAMANLLFDIHLSEAMESSNFIGYNECKFIYTKIFEKHKVTPANFDSAVIYYANHNNEHKEVYKLVEKKIVKYIDNCDKKFFNRFPKETISVWKDYAIFPDSLTKLTQFLPFYICPKPDYLDKPLIIEK